MEVMHRNGSLNCRIINFIFIASSYRLKHLKDIWHHKYFLELIDSWKDSYGEWENLQSSHTKHFSLFVYSEKLYMTADNNLKFYVMEVKNVYETLIHTRVSGFPSLIIFEPGF